MTPQEGLPCVPTQKDVLFGRDTTSWINGGNRLLRRMIEKHHDNYTPTMTRAQLRKLIATIVNDLKSSGARFLKLDHSTRQYYEVDDKTCLHKVGRTIRDQHVTYQRRKDKRKKAEDAYKQQVVGVGSIDSRATTQSIIKVANSDLAAKPMEPPEFASINDTRVLISPSLLPEDGENAAAMFEIVRRGVQNKNTTGQPTTRRPQSQIGADARLSDPRTLTSRGLNADVQACIAGRSECGLHGTLAENLFTAAGVRFPHSQHGNHRFNGVGDNLLAATREMHQIEYELARRQQRLRALDVLVTEGRGQEEFNPYSQSEFPMLGQYCDRILAGGRGPLPVPRELLPPYLLRPLTTLPPIAPTCWLPDFSGNL